MKRCQLYMARLQRPISRWKCIPHWVYYMSTHVCTEVSNETISPVHIPLPEGCWASSTSPCCLVPTVVMSAIFPDHWKDHWKGPATQTTEAGPPSHRVPIATVQHRVWELFSLKCWPLNCILPAQPTGQHQFCTAYWCRADSPLSLTRLTCRPGCLVHRRDAQKLCFPGNIYAEQLFSLPHPLQ